MSVIALLPLISALLLVAYMAGFAGGRRRKAPPDTNSDYWFNEAEKLRREVEKLRREVHRWKRRALRRGVEALAALGEPLAVLEISMKCERCSRWVCVPEGTTQDECQRNCPVYPSKTEERKNVMRTSDKPKEGVQQVLTHGDGYRDFKVIEKVEPKPAKKKLSGVPYVIAFCMSTLVLLSLRQSMDFNFAWFSASVAVLTLRYVTSVRRDVP